MSFKVLVCMVATSPQWATGQNPAVMTVSIEATGVSNHELNRQQKAVVRKRTSAVRVDGRAQLELGAVRIMKSAKKKDLAAGDAHDYLRLSAVVRRDLLWHAIHDVDDKFGSKYVCETSEGTTYARQAHFFQGQTAFTKANIGSARECALMCAADTFGERSHGELACKSFAFNKTSKECKLFNFAQQAQDTQVKDECCTTGPPCNLNSMREEIQKAFEKELKQEMLSQKQRDNRLKTKVETNAETQAATQTKHTVAKVEQKAAVKTEHIAPKAEPKAATQTGPGKPLSDHIEQKPAVKTEHIAPKAEPKAAKQTGPGKPLSDHIAPTSILQALLAHWRPIAIWAGIVLFAISIYGILTVAASETPKRFSM